MNLALKLSSTLQADFRAASQRLKQVNLVSENYGALVTDNLNTALNAAEQGCHILLHNWDMTAIRAVDEACRKSGTTFMPSHPWRFRPSVQALIKSHHAGELGEPGLVRIHSWSAETVSKIDAAMILPELDLTLWIFGSSYASAHVVSKGADKLLAHLGFAKGGMALIDYAWGVPSAYDSFSLIGSSGAAYADDHHNMNLLFADHLVKAIKTSQSSMHLNALLEEFINTIKEERASILSATDTLLALETAQSILKTAEVRRA